MNSILRSRCVALSRAFSTSVVKKCAVPPVPPKRPSRITSAITWKSMTATALIGGGLTAFVIYVRQEKQAAIDRERKRELGKAKIGGQFELVNTEITLLVSLWSNTYGQEYLPPKIGGGGPKKPIPEPTLPANYDFSYDVQDNGVSLDFGHNEKRKEDHATGSYHVLLPDGRMQLVEYEAGPDGYKPQVMYMGTATFPPAGGAADKFDGYHYNAASNRQSVRQAAPRGSARAATAPPAPHPAPPAHTAPHNATQ